MSRITDSKAYLLSKKPLFHGFKNVLEFNEDYKVFRKIRGQLNKDNGGNLMLATNQVIKGLNCFGRDFIRVMHMEFKDKRIHTRVRTILHFLGKLEDETNIDYQFLKVLECEVSKCRY